MTKHLYSDQLNQLCMILLRERKKAGLTQENIAEAVGRPQSFVTKYENGDRRLDVLELIEICGIIGYDPKLVIEELQKHQKKNKKAKKDPA